MHAQIKANEIKAKKPQVLECVKEGGSTKRIHSKHITFMNSEDFRNAGRG